MFWGRQIRLSSLDRASNLLSFLLHKHQPLIEQVSDLEATLRLLTQNQSTLSSDVATLTTEKQEAQQRLNAINGEYEQAKAVLTQKLETEQTVNQLESRQKALTSALEQLEPKTNEINALNQALEEAKQKIQQLKSDTSQIDYKEQVASLQRDVSDLERDLRTERAKENYCWRCGAAS